jgi:hypothetical protein
LIRLDYNEVDLDEFIEDESIRLKAALQLASWQEMETMVIRFKKLYFPKPQSKVVGLKQ